MVNSRFLYFPTPLKSLPRPAEVLQSPTTPGGRPAGSSRRAAATTPGESLGEACEGLRRLLLEKARGSSRRAAETTPGEGLGKPAKWRELAAKIGAKTAKWRELAAKLDAKTAKWREVARSS